MTGSDRTVRGRPRSAETDRAIIEGTLDLLRASGPTAVNIDAVSTATGVARTTIYRRYRSRDELMTAALETLVQAPLPVPSLPVVEKLRWMLDRIRTVLEDGIGRGGLAAVLMDSDPAFTGALRSGMAERLGALAEEMAADVGSGRMRPDIDPDTLVGLLFGAYLSEVLRYGTTRPGWADRAADLLATAVRAE